VTALQQMTLSSVERQVILLSAGIAARRREMRERAAGLTAEVDWSRLAETLRGRRLLPTLGPRIMELAEGRASDRFAAAVEQALEAGRRQSAVLQLISMSILAMLADAGIRATPLKGPLLGEAIYGDPGRRLSSDIDLLVATEQLHAAVEIVRQLGYAAPTDHLDHSHLPQLHFLLVDERQKLPPVELHWRVHCYERSFARERLLPPAGRQPGHWRPAPVDELVALLLFYARDGFIDLRLAADLGAWWDVRGGELQHGALDEPLRAYPALARAVRVAAKVAEKVVGLPTTSLFADKPRLGVRGRIAIGLANPNPHASGSQLYADMGLVDGLLAPRGGLAAFVRRRVLLPREVLDELDRRVPKRRPRSSLGRGVGMLGRYALRMTRLVLARDRTLR
jgi:hypothetical protein